MTAPIIAAHITYFKDFMLIVAQFPIIVPWCGILPHHHSLYHPNTATAAPDIEPKSVVRKQDNSDYWHRIMKDVERLMEGYRRTRTAFEAIEIWKHAVGSTRSDVKHFHARNHSTNLEKPN